MNTVIARAVKYVGGTSAMAKSLGVSAPTVTQWVNATRPIPAHRCIAIERATGGKVTRYELREDVFGAAPDKAA